jgi:hypothetical protein
MVLLKCVREGSKLRVKIISPGYIVGANCRFPRDIRVENRMYDCPESSITLSQTRAKYFYIVSKQSITILNDDYNPMSIQTENKPVLNDNFKIYTDVDNADCSICLTEPKELVFVPCGHFMSCSQCNQMLKKRTCPICRVVITNTITPDQIG